MPVTIAREGEKATVTMSNPERMNALSSSACETMADEVQKLAHDDSVRCVTVTGEGAAFCSGIDLESLDIDNPARELEAGLHAVATSLLRMKKPVVAAVSGPAVGAGASIATACDFVYAAESATFGWGFTDIGLAPDTGATAVLPRLVGVRTAMELLTTGRQVDAHEAVALGLATEAIPDAELAAVVDERVEMLLSRPTCAVGEAKRLVLRNTHRSIEEALVAEAETQDRIARTEDAAEGIAAFAEKRDPEFTGR